MKHFYILLLTLFSVSSIAEINKQRDVKTVPELIAEIVSKRTYVVAYSSCKIVAHLPVGENDVIPTLKLTGDPKADLEARELYGRTRVYSLYRSATLGDYEAVMCLFRTGFFWSIEEIDETYRLASYYDFPDSKKVANFLGQLKDLIDRLEDSPEENEYPRHFSTRWSDGIIKRKRDSK